MDENAENMNLVEESGKKDNNPLSVRIDANYKEMFEEIIKDKGVSKKALLESMILSYIEINENKKGSSNIDFSYEIALVSGSINEILGTIKSIAAKAQNTIGSHKDYYEQQLQNLSLKVQTLENINFEMEEKNKLLEAANTGYGLEKEKLKDRIGELEAKQESKEKEKNSLNEKITELLEQINVLRRVERENLVLNNENKELIQELGKLKSLINDKSLENESLKRKLDVLTNDLDCIKNKKAEEVAEIELRLKKEAELNKKSVILQMQIQYNDLQAENLRNLGVINEKSEEIKSLKRNLEKVEQELEHLHNKILEK